MPPMDFNNAAKQGVRIFKPKTQSQTTQTQTRQDYKAYLDALSAALSRHVSSWAPRLFPSASISHDRTELRMANIDGTAPREQGSTVIHLMGEWAGWYSEWDANGRRGIHKGPLGVLKDSFPHRDCVQFAEEIIAECGGAGYLANMAQLAVSKQKKASADQTSERHKQDMLLRARSILSDCRPQETLAGTPALIYLRARNIDWIPQTIDLRFNDSVWEKVPNLMRKAIVAIRRDIFGNPTGGIHVIYLLDDLSWHTRNIKRNFGPRGFTHLGPIDPQYGILGLGTGIETTFSAMKIFGVPGAWAVPADSGFGMFAAALRENVNLLHTLPFKRLLIWADNDKSSIDAAEFLRKTCEDIGFPAVACLPISTRNKADFADDLKDGLQFKRDRAFSHLMAQRPFIR